jgi:hypothetical protein
VRSHFINECCFGDDCAAWLVDALRAQGWRDVSDAWQEDWGWQAGYEQQGRKYLISIGLIPEDEPEWLVHVQESRSLFARVTGRLGPSVRQDLVLAIDAALQREPDIRDVRWHLEDVFLRGRSTGAPDPLVPRSSAEAAV